MCGTAFGLARQLGRAHRFQDGLNFWQNITGPVQELHIVITAETASPHLDLLVVTLPER